MSKDDLSQPNMKEEVPTFTDYKTTPLKEVTMTIQKYVELRKHNNDCFNNLKKELDEEYDSRLVALTRETAAIDKSIDEQYNQEESHD